MKKILLLGSQHGDELLGDKLFSYLSKRRPELLKHVSFKIGNPKAHKMNVQFIDSNLNRSYIGKRSTYEERLAARILRYIDTNKFDLVLDLHTTTCDQPVCMIIASISSQNLDFLRSSSIDKIVIMKHDIATTSLIGKRPQTVCIEVFKDKVDECLLKQICDDIERYIDDEFCQNIFDKQIFQIDGTINKGELTPQQAFSLKNFERSELGIVPFLVGENSYCHVTDYYGFKAHEIN